MESKLTPGTIVKLKNLKDKRLFGHLFVVLETLQDNQVMKVSPITSLSNYDEERLKKYGQFKYVIKDWKEAGLSHESLVSLDTQGALPIDQYLFSVEKHLSKDDSEGVLKKGQEVARIHQRVESIRLTYASLNESFTTDAVMLSRYGVVYPGIDNAYHPNTGSQEDGYPEIERVVDWLFQHEIKGVYPALKNWIFTRTAQAINDGYDSTDLREIVNEVLCADIYTPCAQAQSAVEDALYYFKSNRDVYKEFLKSDLLQYSEQIATYLNEKFLRIRVGGKLNPEGADAIYFRISSHGYDWHRCIVDFLWDVFSTPDKMPKRIVVCTDAETNPPERVYFDGSPDDFLNEDQKVYESLRSEVERGLDSMNLDRKSQIMNKRFSKHFDQYISYK